MLKSHGAAAWTPSEHQADRPSACSRQPRASRAKSETKAKRQSAKRTARTVVISVPVKRHRGSRVLCTGSSLFHAPDHPVSIRTRPGRCVRVPRGTGSGELVRSVCVLTVKCYSLFERLTWYACTSSSTHSLVHIFDRSEGSEVRAVAASILDRSFGRCSLRYAVLLPHGSRRQCGARALNLGHDYSGSQACAYACAPAPR